MTHVSFVIPAYREAWNIAFISHAIRDVMKSLERQYTYEIIFINDGSPDTTWQEIEKQSWESDHVRGINLSRNFGKEIALTAGLECARGDLAITLDADGQHPPEKIPDFLKEWEKWSKIVYNRRPITHGASRIKRISSRLFYVLFNTISDFKLEPGTTDYRLIDRQVIDAFLQFHEKNRFYRWLIDWLGFDKTCLIFDADPRRSGKASYHYGKLLKLAINNLTSFSLFPLKLVGYTGLLVTFSSLIILFIQFLDKIHVLDFWFSNIGIIVVLNTIMIGIVLMSLGLIGLYIANIHEEVIGRPLYIIKEKINF